ncbi:hypothetical protein Tco_1050357 [Tanacetum coccineum]
MSTTSSLAISTPSTPHHHPHPPTSLLPFQSFAPSFKQSFAPSCKVVIKAILGSDVKQHPQLTSLAVNKELVPLLDKCSMIP